jgi:hypothetical protein
LVLGPVSVLPFDSSEPKKKISHPWLPVKLNSGFAKRVRTRLFRGGGEPNQTKIPPVREQPARNDGEV